MARANGIGVLRTGSRRNSRATPGHSDWGPFVFSYGRNEVKNFLLANALFWAREFHAGVISAAEESAAWPGVSRPTYLGGLVAPDDLG